MTTDQSPHTRPAVDKLEATSGIRIYDPVEDVRVDLRTDQPVDPEPTQVDEFVYPVDTASVFHTQRLWLTRLEEIRIRNHDGDLIRGTLKDQDTVEVGRGDYLLELSGVPVKVYLKVDDVGVSVGQADGTTFVQFDVPTTVTTGMRSLHSRPGFSIGTTDDPRDIMRAISLFGRAMKTWSPERTWPYLRGHPPALTSDDDGVDPTTVPSPTTGITIRVPPEYEWIFPAVPLAYWMGATVEPGQPSLEVGATTYHLGDGDETGSSSGRNAYERDVRDILRGTFLFDCALRSGTFVDVDLKLRRELEAADIGVDFESLYDAPLVERVQTYMDIVRDQIAVVDAFDRPGWPLTADVQPDPERVEILPYLANELAEIRCPDPDDRGKRLEALRSTCDGPTVIETDGRRHLAAGLRDLHGSSSGIRRSGRESVADRLLFDLPPADSTSHAWAGDGFAVGAAKVDVRSYKKRRRIRRASTHTITVDVIVNDREMVEEARVTDIYGSRDNLDFEVRLHRDLDATEFKNVLQRETDLLHYVGHVDGDGFACSDGHVSVDAIESVGAEMFILNACRSYDQGQGLIERGAVAGVVTFQDVPDATATDVGEDIARLLNYGFPIDCAIQIIRETTVAGHMYAVLGDAHADLAQSNIGTPNHADVSIRDERSFDLCMETYANRNFGVGAAFHPYLDQCEHRYLVPGELDTWTVDDAALDEFLDISPFPVIANGDLYWSDQVTAAELRERLEETD